MSGHIDLQWNGRNITIERKTKGRTPMGDFRAYETDSGIDVPELTAANCGEQLLGVERSVFLRSGFVRLTDLPVTEDEQLRRRLNALVTTGDESQSADILAQKLKELKNKVRYNRSGLLPTAEKEAAELEAKLRQISELQQQIREFDLRLQQKRQDLTALENHKAMLEYVEAEENNRRIMQAQMRRDLAKEKLEEMENQCRDLPDGETCADLVARLQQLHQQSMALDMEQQMLPPMPEKSATVTNCDPEQAAQDVKTYHNILLELKKVSDIVKIALCSGTVAAIGLLLSLIGQNGLLAVLTGALLLGCVVGAGCFYGRKGKLRRQMADLTEKYGSDDLQKWETDARSAWESMCNYEKKRAEYDALLNQMRQKREMLNVQIRDLTNGQPVSQCLQQWENVAHQWEMLKEARANFENAKNHADVVSAMAKTLEKPALSDELTCSMEQTVYLLEQNRDEIQKLLQRQGLYQGSMETLGNQAELEGQLRQLRKRIGKLNRTYAALELAQATLATATAELQRRFAPQIAKQAQEIFGQLTDGRYDRLTLSQDMSLQAGAEEESVLHTAQWRSEGTVDQMYLSLRIAVSKALTPDAPLILDDALVRFDDVRHAAAMEILKQQAQHRQIILFTCQNREEQYV